LLYLNIVQILISIVIVLIILAQVKEAGAGLFGSAQSTVRTRRGLEKTLFQFTIILAAVFLGISILSVRGGDRVWETQDTIVMGVVGAGVLVIAVVTLRFMK
jgi:preprotein translocase subunit SecG